ncbi:MAG: glycosyltransferase [Flavobacteriaceae bacterium]
MKVLILTYYFPPAGGSGVQRWLKFVKYLPQFDVEPIVYTVKNPNYPLTDTSLLKEVSDEITILKQPIFEPSNFLPLKKNKQSAGFLTKNPNFIQKIIHFIRANYFIPDARKFWIKPSVKYLNNYIKEHNIKTVITTGPPHSVHLIGLKLKQQNNLKWIADFRDPWTDIDYFHQLPLTKKALKKHTELEALVLKNADNVIVIGKTMQSNYLKFNENTHVIPNGFDTFNENESVSLTKKFSLLHIGMLNSDRNHTMLWKVLSELMTENRKFSDDLEIKLIGKICTEAMDSIKQYNLSNKVTHIDYIKHQAVFAQQQAAQVLILLINNVPSAKGIITGKIFEYLQAKRPILAIAPNDGDLAEIIKNTNSGMVVSFNDEASLKKSILSLYESYKNNTLAVSSKNIEKYHRKSLTKTLAELLKQKN